MKILIIAISALCSLSARAQTNAMTTTNLVAATNAAPPQPTIITSKRADFDMTAHKAIYRDNVFVNNPGMKLHCVLLTADLPPSGGRPNHIVADTNVVVDATDDKGQVTHIVSDRAIYDYLVKDSVTNETVTFTGHARMDNPQATITAEPIVWDRAQNHFTFTDQKMIFHQGIDFSQNTTNRPVANTNKPPATK